MSDDAPRPNVVMVTADGPLLLRGEVVVEAADGRVLLEGDRAALCRCGSSSNPPFCDGTHGSIGFEDPAHIVATPSNTGEGAPPTGPLKVQATEGGPLLVSGSFDVRGSDGQMAFRDGRGALCACGRAGTKPLCDGTHSK